MFHALTDDQPARGYSYVLSTYSTLKVADEGADAFERMTAVYNAFENTQELVRLLQMVYHNVRHYFQIQTELLDINKVLASHFDDFGQKVVETYIRPLKVKDSVPKYKIPIQIILNRWIEDDEILYSISNAAFQDKRGSTVDACRDDILTKIYWVKERYESLERDYLDEIDIQVRRYTRATTQKIENLTNRDQNIRGNLNYLLNALSRNRRSAALVDEIQDAFRIYEQSFLTEKSLWSSRKPRKRVLSEPILIEESKDVDISVINEVEELLRSKYGKEAVNAYMQLLFEQCPVLYTGDFGMNDDEDYLMSLLALLRSDDRDAFYTVTNLNSSFSKGVYTAPQLKFVRKEEKV
jgi:hypothetical protein